MEWLKLGEWIQKSKPICIVILIITTILLFAPEIFLNRLALTDFKNAHNLWIGIVFLFTLSLTCWFFIEQLTAAVKLCMQKKKYIKKISEIIKNLDKVEQSVIREFFLQEKNTINAPIQNSAVQGLLNKKMLIMPASLGSQAIGEQTIVGLISAVSLNQNCKQYFDKSGFDEIKNVDRPNWVQQIEASNAQHQRKIEMMNSYL